MTSVEDGLGVSRETVEKLTAFAEHVQRWTTKINLISPVSQSAFWERHIVDSLQLLTVPGLPAGRWVDLGSGGGLPGIVVAIADPSRDYVMVESDKRKAAFLRSVATDLGLRVNVLAERIEKVPPLRGQVVSARALKPLEELLALVNRHLDQDGIAVLPKGRRYDAEIKAARRLWSFHLDLVPSMTDPEARLLRVTNIKSRRSQND